MSDIVTHLGVVDSHTSARSPMLRFIGCASPLWRYLIITLIASLLFVALSASLIWLIGPLAGTLFGESVTMTGTPPMDTAAGIGGWLDQIKMAWHDLINDLIVRGDRIETLARLCMAILLIALIKGIVRYVQSLTLTIVQQRVIQSLRDALFSHYQALSLAYYSRTRSGQIIARVSNDVHVLSNMLDVGFGSLLRDPLLVVALFVSLLVINWELTVVSFIILPLSVTAITLAGRFIKKYSRRSQNRMADLMSILEENTTGVRVVKAFNMAHYEIKRFAAANRGYYNAMLKMMRVRHLNSPISELLGTVAGVAILWYGGRAVLLGQGLSPSEFMTFIFLTFAIIQPIKSLATVHARVAEGRAAAERVFEALDIPVDVADRSNARPLTAFNESIRYDNVSFHYEKGGWALRAVNLQIPRGFSVALVGPSGGGKSTLCDLLARFADPLDGRISIDGIDIRDLTISSLRSNLGIVTQDVILFHDSVARNIAYGEDTIDDARLRRAAEAASALEFIQQLPQEFDTVIGPRGVRLSGGQRQRIAIARAIYKDPPILIFDEATSSLDTESEVAVQRAIDNLLRDRTALIVAHRLSTIRNADLIAVIDGGRVVDTGTHESLLERGGVYRRLYDMQFANPSDSETGNYEPTRPVL